MKVLSTRDFKASFSSIVKEREEIIVTQRGKPLGIFQPMTEKKLKERRIAVALRLVSLGNGRKGRISEEHDEAIYEE